MYYYKSARLALLKLSISVIWKSDYVPVIDNFDSNYPMPSQNNLSIFFAACTAERFFRIDKAQEHLHYLADVTHDSLYVLNTVTQTPDEEGPFLPVGQSPELR